LTAVNDLTAFVLAGGKSTRMGSDKAFLDFKSRTLLDRALATLQSLTPEVLIVGDRARFAGHGSVVEDVFRDRGPLGGIHAALSVSATEFNVVLAVDLPFVEPDLLGYLLKRARSATAMAVVPRLEDGWEPLCAVYRNEFKNWAERSLLQGRNKIDALFGELEVLAISDAELREEGFSSSAFRNLNTPADVDQARRVRQSGTAK
jgi:molybdenum cofactor guanylyltransferase